jgi:hypothetical protein
LAAVRVRDSPRLAVRQVIGRHWDVVIRRPAASHLIQAMKAHLPARDHGLMDPVPALYAIRIKGQLGATALSAFPALVPRQHGADTVLTGFLDQSALFGVLAAVEALGLELVEVRQVTRPRRSPGPGGGRAQWL